MTIPIFISQLTDTSITYWFIITVFGYVLTDYFFRKFKYAKRKGVFFNEDTRSQNTSVKEYGFDFQNSEIDSDTLKVKKVSFFTKTILFLFALVIMLVPFYEFVETLRPQEIVYGWSCFPFIP